MNNRFNRVALNEGSMSEAASKIRNEAEEIKVALDAINAEVAQVANAWSDKNAETYMEKYQELQKDFPAFYNHAYGFSKFLDGVVKTYRENVLDPTTRAVKGD